MGASLRLRKIRSRICFDSMVFPHCLGPVTKRKYGGFRLTLLKMQEDIGEITTTINDVATHEMKDIILKIKRLSGVELPIPHRVKGCQSLTLNVVMVYNETYNWILLTDLPVEILEDCEFVVTIYKQRWHIEDYHKILKFFT
jgi:hypothetical protein